MGFGPVDDRTTRIGGIALTVAILLLVGFGIFLGWILWG